MTQKLPVFPDKIVFKRKRQDDSMLVCAIKDATLVFSINNKKIEKTSLMDICELDYAKDRLKKEDYERLKNAGATHFWNLQIPLFPEEVEKYISAQKELYAHNKFLEAYNKRNKITILLSTRGWGDFSPVEWTGYIDTPANDVLEQCRKLLDSAFDADRNPSDDEVLEMFEKAKNDKIEQNNFREEVLADARKTIAEVTPQVLEAFRGCGGDAENLEDDIDHPLYWRVKAYAEALEHCDRLGDAY